MSVDLQTAAGESQGHGGQGTRPGTGIGGDKVKAGDDTNGDS